MQAVKITLPHNDVFDPDLIDIDFSIQSDQNHILIKEFVRGSISVSDGGSETVTHNLGYIPHFLTYTPLTNGRYRLTTEYNVYAPWSVYADSTNIYITNDSGADAIAKYYIFYDNID